MTTVIKKSTRLIAIMRRLRNSLTKNALTTFYKLYIWPISEYASTTWCNLTQTQSGRLERCQRRIGMSLFQHIRHGELLSSAKLVSLSSRRKLALALLGHQLYYKNAPPHLQQVTFPERVTPYSLRNTQSFALPTARTTSYQHSVILRSLEICSSLPSGIKGFKSFSRFKRAATAQLLSQKCDCSSLPYIH